MIETSALLTFVAASLVLLLLPGPGVLYVVARSLGQGRPAGIIAAAGLSVGALVHVMAAVIGLSAILLHSATAFTVIKYVGAAYLVWLAWQAFRMSTGSPDIRRLPAASARRIFLDGVVVSIFNPKIALFFLAFLPQFVSPQAGSATAQIAILGGLYAVLSFVSDSLYAILADSLRSLLRRQGTNPWLSRYLPGGLFLGLAVKTALTDRP